MGKTEMETEHDMIWDVGKVGGKEGRGKGRTVKPGAGADGGGGPPPGMAGWTSCKKGVLGWQGEVVERYQR
jgi:hypothetical protein